MFEVLVFVYENYFASDNRPEPAFLERKLNAVGFEADEVIDAMNWLRALNAAALGSSHPHLGTSPMGMQQPTPPEPWLREPSSSSVRIYPANEQRHLGALCLGFISFLESAGVMSAPMREVVIDRAMAAPGAPVALDDFKIIILMVFWSFGQVPDALILDELCEDNSCRVAH